MFQSVQAGWAIAEAGTILEKLEGRCPRAFCPAGIGHAIRNHAKPISWREFSSQEVCQLLRNSFWRMANSGTSLRNRVLSKALRGLEG